MSYENIQLEVLDTALAVITINRPKKLNALNKATIEELHDAFKQADAHTKVKTILLTGSGEKAFVAGADISEFADFSVEAGAELAARGQHILFDFIENLGTPVIAAINGFALGGGLELAMACHFRVASVTAKMGLPEVSLGLIPGYGGTQRLANLVGKGLAMEMILTARMIDAQKALTHGLVNYVVPQEALLGLCKTLAAQIAKNSTQAMAAAIKAVNANFKHSVDGYAVEINAFGNCFGTADFKEGTTAFLEKRKAKFSGK